MPEKVRADKRLTKVASQSGLLDTYLGQAHIAGTGPGASTCRSCVWWKRVRSDEQDHAWDRDGQIKPSRCTYPIGGKADRLVPHYAKACSLFKQNDNPPAITVDRSKVIR